MNKCPCCGAEMDFTKVDQLLFIDLSGVQRKILDCIIESYPRPQTMIELLRYTYPNPVDEPEHGEMTIRVNITKLRKKLPEYGWTIPSQQSGKGKIARYKLVEVNKNANI